MVSQKPVFDYFPPGTPRLFNDAIEKAVKRVSEQGNPLDVWDEMENAQVRQLQSNESFRRKMREAYDEAGVNLICATTISLNPSKAITSINHSQGVIEDLFRWQAVYDSVDWLSKVTSPKEARETVLNGDVGVILTCQDLGSAIADGKLSVAMLDKFGVPMLQLTYNSHNILGAGCTENSEAGLSNRGIEVVEDLNERGIIVDVAHCGERTTLDTLDASDSPIAFSHAACQDVGFHDRGKSDEEIKRLAKNDGYMGIFAIPDFLSNEEQVSFNKFFDHVDHAVSLLGVERVGIGTDWGVFSPDVPEFVYPSIEATNSSAGFRSEHGIELGKGIGPLQEYSDWQAIPDGLRDRGYSEDETSKILGENFLTFWERVKS
jgi:membrane dipeptidase